MERGNGITASSKNLLPAKWRIRAGAVLAALLFIFSGCATIMPQPVTISNEGMPVNTKIDAAPDGQKQAGASTERNLEELVELMRRKGLISAGEAARLLGKPAPAAAETRERQRIDEITARVTKEVMKSLPEQVKRQVRQNLPKEVQENEKGTADKITADVTAAISKHLQEQVSKDIQIELPVEIKNAGVVAPAPDWTRRIRFGGDVRLRYEEDRFDKNNDKELPQVSQGGFQSSLQNTWANQDRFKYRVRVGAEAKINDQVQAVIRLSTGNTGTPVSTNQIIGSYFERGNVLFDLAYLQWRPWAFLSITGGRMPNPFFSTDLVWARDLNFEGLVLSARGPVSKKSTLTPFATAGAFPLEQSGPTSVVDFSQHGKWLYAAQVGLDRRDQKGISATVGAAYYSFQNISAVLNNDPVRSPGATDWSEPVFQQKGNQLCEIDPSNLNKEGLCSEFKELNLTGNLDIGFWDPYHVVFSADFVKNLGFDKSEIAQRTGIIPPAQATVGYQAGIAVGYPATLDWGQWKAYLSYKRLESDAVVDAFTDSDFHLGGTNAKGWILGADIGLRRDYWLTVRWLTADEIDGPPLAIDVLQVDLNAVF